MSFERNVARGSQCDDFSESLVSELGDGKASNGIFRVALNLRNRVFAALLSPSCKAALGGASQADKR